MAKLSGGEALERKLAEMAKGLEKTGTLRIGWPENATYPESGLQVGLVAAFSEFGVPSHNQPPRPFMRIAIRDNSDSWAPQIANLLKATNYDAPRVLDMMGSEICGQVRDSIDALFEPPLSPRTIARKGHDKPLIDSNIMRSTLTWEVTEGGVKTRGWFSSAIQKIKGWFGA